MEGRAHLNTAATVDRQLLSRSLNFFSLLWWAVGTGFGSEHAWVGASLHHHAWMLFSDGGGVVGSIVGSCRAREAGGAGKDIADHRRQASTVQRQRLSLALPFWRSLLLTLVACIVGWWHRFWIGARV
ncbi:hypothetical protein T484DRAFT_1932923, partial [Baffinella frigidus]